MSEKSASLIREILNKHRLSISEFAKLTNLSRASIHKYLLGKPMKTFSARKISNNLWQKLEEAIPYQEFIE